MKNLSKKTFKIAMLPGDGIGPEVTAEALKGLNCAKLQICVVKVT